MIRKLVIGMWAGMLCLAPALFGQGVGAQYQGVFTKATEAPTLEKNLRTLTDEIGGRVPGTPQMDEAVKWAVAAFKAAGADDVHTEDFTMQTSWREGATDVEVTSPTRFKLRATSIAWSPAIQGTLTTRVVDVGFGSPKEFAKAGDISGAIVLVHSHVLHKWQDLFNEYLDAPPIIDQALKGKAAAIAWTSTRKHDVLYRHINAPPEKFDRIPSVLLAREDALRVARLIESGKKVEMSITLPNYMGGPIKTQNVVAEIRGSEEPNQFVLLGAHLDSWNLGTGALDNGCDAAMVIEALRAIKSSGFKPKRTIRFVLFSGEEEGMLGSWAYATQHKSEMDNADAVVIFDSGSGRITGYSLGGRKDVLAKVNEMTKPFEARGPIENTTDAFVGTDNLDFLLDGVPTLVANQVEANYLVNYHASSDTYDKVDMTELKKNLVIAAYTMAYLADTPRLGPRQTRPEIEQLMKETGLDEQMKLFNVWSQWEDGTRGRSRQ